MDNIGLLIRQLREEKALTRTELAVGICSEKYIYLIERGDRTPSAEMLRLLGRKLQTDIFQYFRYSDCIEPLKVARIIESLAEARGIGDYRRRLSITEEAKDMPDFKEKPWIYVLQGAAIEYKLVYEGKAEEALRDIEKVIAKLETKYIESEFATVLYLTQTFSLERMGRYEEAYKIALKVEAIQEAKKAYYNVVAIQVTLETKYSILLYLYRLKHYSEAFQRGSDLIDIMADNAIYSRCVKIAAFTAFSAYHLGKLEDVMFYMKVAMSILMITKNPIDIVCFTKEPDYEPVMSIFDPNDFMLKEFQLFIENNQKSQREFKNKVGEL